MTRAFQRLACTFLILLLSAFPAMSEKRVALVIGNGAYQSTPALANPANDAGDMAAALKEVGFEVILAKDVDNRAMERAIVQFARLSQDADASLFYYAGHGIQHRGNNYLVPIDARLEDEFSLNFELARVSDVISALEQARGVKILVLDACRNNPLADKLTRLSASRQFGAARGLARIDAIRGMIIAYATQPDQVAVDGTGRNSPFTRALLKQIAEPGVEIGTLFRRVAMDVNHATGGRQLPELSVSLFGEFYLNTRETDLQAWAKIRNTDDPAALQEFMQQYPRSALATDARMRMAAIERENAERERLRRLKEERERVQREKERLEREQAERDRLEAERKRLEAEQLERERLAREAAARTQSEQERLEAERIERERLARETAERERMRKEQERLLREYAERERLARERLAREIAEREQRERQRLAKEFAEREKEREEQERQWRERAEKAQREREALARQLAEREQRDRERQESEAAERARLALLSKPDAPVAPVAPDTAKPREEPDISRELQKELQRVGCYTGPIDGQWGPKSEAALRSFLRITGDAKTVPRPEPGTLAAVAARKDRACPVTASRPPPASAPSPRQNAAPPSDKSARPRVGQLRPRCFRQGDMSACRELCAYFGPQAGACARLRGGGAGLRRGYGLGPQR